MKNNRKCKIYDCKNTIFFRYRCTQYVVESFKNEIEDRNNSVKLVRIGKAVSDNKKEYDLLIICYVVHACNAPKPVFDRVRQSEDAGGIPTAIISVSGGGEVTPNLACRLFTKNELTKHDFSVFYEKMIVMPSNWIVSTKPILVNKLFDILPYKISYFTDDILNMKKSLFNPGIGKRLISLIGKLEHYGAVHQAIIIPVFSICCNGWYIVKLKTIYSDAKVKYE